MFNIPDLSKIANINALIELLRETKDKNKKAMILQTYIAEYGPVPNEYGDIIRDIIDEHKEKRGRNKEMKITTYQALDKLIDEDVITVGDNAQAIIFYAYRNDLINGHEYKELYKKASKKYFKNI